jgi:hypothetical protein
MNFLAAQLIRKFKKRVYLSARAGSIHISPVSGRIGGPSQKCRLGACFPIIKDHLSTGLHISRLSEISAKLRP